MEKLKPGDTVAIIAPASHQVTGAENLVEQGLSCLEAWGLNVRLLCSPEKKHFYLAGEDEYRAEMLRESLTDPEIRAVFATRGGYGSLRILPILAGIEVPQPRYFCGFSDLTVFLMAFEQQFPSVQAIHSPGIANRAFTGEEVEAALNRDRLHQVLFGNDKSYSQDIQVIKPGTASGPIVGGCLSVLLSLFGTAYEPEFSGKILFLEDVAEKPYVIDRLLTQLVVSGKLERVKGIVFGDMPDCSDGQNNLQEVIADALRSVLCPIVYGFRCGHGDVNVAFELGQLATINTQSKTFSLS